jgi:hypothetical protein
MRTESPGRLSIAVIGTGISGMAAAWLLSGRHEVTVYERSDRVGGHSNTVDVDTPFGDVPVDTGFIVYNEQTYPNLTALLKHLGVKTQASEMSLAVSLDDGRLEYSGGGLAGLFGQKRNVASPRFWSMLRDLRRFYREAPAHIGRLVDTQITLGDYLRRENYGAAFRDDHLLPMASAIWSAPPSAMLNYPAASFIQFHHNHGLLKLRGRPVWRTVVGGSRSYVSRLTGPYRDRVRLNTAVDSIRRDRFGVEVIDGIGGAARYDHVVIATHADRALAMLAEPSALERTLLAPFRYSRNLAVLHSDASLMPKRRAVWSSWNYVGRPKDNLTAGVTVSYWMNRLQNLATPTQLFVTLNPTRPPHAGTIFHSEVYKHPLFDGATNVAQRRLWSLQGRQRTWFCGSYFGAGFHEDGLQSGLAVAEVVGGLRRPWTVANHSGRIFVDAALASARGEAML